MGMASGWAKSPFWFSACCRGDEYFYSRSVNEDEGRGRSGKWPGDFSCQQC